MGGADSSELSLGRLVVETRQRIGLSQEELAELTGLSVRALRNIERDAVSRPQRESLVRIARGLALDGDDTDLLFRLAGKAIRPGGSAVENEPPPADDPAPVRPAQLPADVHGFTGREHYLAQMDGLLGDDGAAVVVSAVAGAPGIGKTALATRWAHRVRHRFPDGQLFADLRGYASAAPLGPMEVLPRFLRALGVRADLIPTGQDEAEAMYRSLLADRRVLILLDNARSPQQVRPLLPGSPGCLVLVTSRDRLTGLVARDGARRLVLEVLTPAEATALLTTVLGEDRVRAERAAAGELAGLCGHLPLGLRIAAAKLSAHPEHRIDAYVAKLRAGDRLAGLAVDGDDQAGVRTAFDPSYAALPDSAQRLFRMIGLVAGPEVTAPAAAALGDTTPTDAEDVLECLAAGHLIAPTAPGRYTMHDLLRQYAAQLALRVDTASVRQAATQRLCDLYLSTVDAAAALVYPDILRLPSQGSPEPNRFTDLADAIAWLDTERPNLVAAVTHAAEHGPYQAAWRLADALRGHLWLSLNFPDWLAVARAGLVAAEADGHIQAQSASHTSLATLAWMWGDQDLAIEHDRKALALARAAGWSQGQGTALNNLGNACRLAGRPTEAAAHLTEALAVNRRGGRLGGQAASVANLGTVYAEMGRLDAAVEQLNAALALYRRLTSRGGEATALGALADLHHLLGRFDVALDLARRGLELHRQRGDDHGECETACVIAEIHRDAGRLDAAMDAITTALAYEPRVAAKRTKVNLCNVLASLLDRRGRHHEALDRRREAGRIAEEAGDRYAEALVCTGLATTHRHLGRIDEALQWISRALDLSRQCHYRLIEGQASTEAAAIHLERGDTARAAEHAHDALAIHRETGHRPGLAHTHVLLERLTAHTGAAVT